MLRICRRCRSEYNGDPGSTLCPSCVREGRKTTIRDRVCRTCGAAFPGGPRAWYCPDCRADRQKAQSRDYHRRKAAGKTRSIGSEDLCEICGNPYTVSSGRQRYCPDCAPAAIAEADRQQGRAWYASNAAPDARRELRQSHAAELKCVICGRPYKPTDASATCSPACSAELHRRTASAWEKDHRAERTQYHRKRRNNQKED